MRSEQLKDTEPHETRGHGHDGHPSRLQAEIHVGEADDGADEESDYDTSHREAAPRNRPRRHFHG